jgi:hemerythrin
MHRRSSWHPDWSLGIEPLDQDHRALMERLTDIYLRHGPRSRHGPASAAQGEALHRDLDALASEAREHFRREQAFLRAIGYAQVASHEAEHGRLADALDQQLAQWRAAGLRTLDERARETLHHWLLAHILGGDRDFARRYFQLCGETPGPAA